MKFDQLGPYRIVAELGRGGMGAVFEGVNVETGEPAAVKLLSAALAGDASFRERFAGEIETLRKLNHPNIVRLFGFGEQDDYLFYAMELVDGSSLEDELSQGRRFDWRETTQIGIEVCQALRHAHDRGIVHRDLKPGNLLLTPDGHVKLSDFGIARLFGNSSRTQAGAVIGTAEYMAPEQAEGKPVDAHADLYSVGAVLYVLLARRQLFQAKSLIEMLQKQRLEKPEPLRKFAVDCPAELEQIIMQLLEKEPEKRIASAAVLSRRLTALQQAMAVSPLANDSAVRESVSESFELEHRLPGKESVGERSSSASDLPATRLATPAGVSASSSDDLPETKATAMLEPPVVEIAPPAAVAPARSSGRFVAVDESELDPIPEDGQDERPPWVSPWTWALVAALIAVAGVSWYLLQLPSADNLYNRITGRFDGSSESLLSSEDDIADFLARFHSDPRVDELEEFQGRIELDKLEKKLDRHRKGHMKAETILPVERAYLEAINYASVDSDVGIAKLQAVIDLFDGNHDSSGPTGLCIELARRRLERLLAEQRRAAADLLESLHQQLDEAEALREEDPEAAGKLYRAMIELYGHKAWAKDALAKARAGLDQITVTDSPPRNQSVEKEHEARHDRP